MHSTPSTSEGPSLDELGWSSFFADHLDRYCTTQSQRTAPAQVPIEPARVVFESRQQYRVLNRRGEQEARLLGRLRQEKTLPAVGDWVLIATPASDSEGHIATIHGILPRRTCLSRKVAGQVTRQQVVAANLDSVFLVMGLDGDFNLRRLERFAVMAHESGAEPVVILSKADLSPDAAGARLDAQQVAPNAPVFVVSAMAKQGLDPLRFYLEPGRTVALIGSSGAGKSTLLNSLSGSEVMRTGAVREGDDRGRHTTTYRQLVRLPSGGILVDNPGVREIQLWADEDALAIAFDDIEALAKGCRFRDCTHRDEPGCSVQRALREGQLDAERLANWFDLEREIQRLELKRDIVTKRHNDRLLGRFYKSVQQAKQFRRR